MFGMKGINQPTVFVNILDKCFSWSCAFYLLWGQLHSVFSWFVKVKTTRVRVYIWQSKEVHKNFIFFSDVHASSFFFLMCFFPLLSIRNGVFFSINLHCLCHFLVLADWEVAAYGTFQWHRKKSEFPQAKRKKDLKLSVHPC